MKIVLIGSGNIATHLGKAFMHTGHQIVQVYSRTLANAQALAKLLNSTGTDSLEAVVDHADLYLLAVSDAVIPEVAAQLPQELEGLVVHASGATHLDVLARFRHAGVIYPIQTFSKSVDLELIETPFAVEAREPADTSTLITFMSAISNRVFEGSSEQRMAMHLAAVFANNFSNALFQVAYDLLTQHDLPFDLIHPIILQTAEKVQNNEPRAVQTGPASRNDQNTINKHLQFISSNPDWQSIYQKISDLIVKRKENNSEN